MSIKYINFINEYMTKSKFVIDKLAELFELGLISYKDLSSEFIKFAILPKKIPIGADRATKSKNIN